MSPHGESRSPASLPSGRAVRPAAGRHPGIPAWLSYCSVLFLQLKLIWGIWRFRDLPFGDTGMYYDMAGFWRDGFRVNVLWSPLYTAFLGSFRFLSEDAYTATMLHRVVIVFLVSVLVLKVARRLLPEPWAWGVAAWWAVLPVHFNALYEVHLFAVVLPLLAVLSALSLPGRKGRGTCLAILAASALLVRTELLAAVALYALAAAATELRERRHGTACPEPEPERSAARAYGVPLAVAFAVCLAFYGRSVVKGGAAVAALEAKHAISTCQPYAFGWKQRHPEWSGDPWNGCSVLMAAHFGDPAPTFLRMFSAAPGRVAEHVLWNLRLTPGGLQLLLFNVMSAPASPDYSEHNPHHPLPAWGATALLASVWILGLAAARRREIAVLAGPALPGWIAMACVAATALLVIPTQRPRPAYLFFAGIFLAALSARLLELALGGTWLAPGAARNRLGIAAMLVAPILAPRYFLLPKHRDENRPLMKAVWRLTPYRDLLRRGGAVTMPCGAGWELEGYVGAGFGPGHRVVPLETACPPEGTDDLEACVARAGGTLVYLDEPCRARLRPTAANRSFAETPGTFGWERLAPAPGSPEPWRILGRTGGGAPQR